MRLDFEVTADGFEVENTCPPGAMCLFIGTMVQKNAFPWMAFIYSSYVRTVLNWVKIVTGMEYHAGISDPGESQEYWDLICVMIN